MTGSNSRGSQIVPRRAVHVAVAGLALLAMLPAASPSSASQPLPAEQWRAVLERWSADLDEARRLLEQGKHVKVVRLMDQRLEEMAQRFRTGDIAARFLGMGSALRALAHAGLGELDEAAWDWSVARSLVPDLEGLDRTPFGEAGAFPDSEEFRNRYGHIEPKPEGPVFHLKKDAELPEGVERPRKIRAPAPSFPRGKADACIEEPLVIRVVIGRDGKPYAPKLASAGDPVLFFTAAQAMREWRFHPARLEGAVVPVFYDLTINYIVPVCDDRFEGR